MIRKEAQKILQEYNEGPEIPVAKVYSKENNKFEQLSQNYKRWSHKEKVRSIAKKTIVHETYARALETQNLKLEVKLKQSEAQIQRRRERDARTRNNSVSHSNAKA